MDAQLGAIVASIYLGMDVVLNVTNQRLSLRRAAGVVARDVALRFNWVGIVVYLIVSLQGSMQAIMPVNRLVHFRRLGDRACAPGDDRVRIVRRDRRDAPRLAAHAGLAL